MLRDPARVGEIVRRVVDACGDTPVSAKIRLGCSENCQTAIEVAQRVEEAGASCLTVHGRVAAQYFKGDADWDAIRQVKQCVSRIPVVGNGDITSAEEAVSRLKDYGVDGVMIARECLSKPWIFAQVAAILRGEPKPPDPTSDEQKSLVLHHYDLVCSRFGVERGTLLMRKFACSYAQGIPGHEISEAMSPVLLLSQKFLTLCVDIFHNAVRAKNAFCITPLGSLWQHPHILIAKVRGCVREQGWPVIPGHLSSRMLSKAT